MPTVSHSWKASLPIRWVGTWPVMQTIGIESISASVRPVTALVAPGPEVTSTHADLAGRARIALGRVRRRPARGAPGCGARCPAGTARHRSAAPRRPDSRRDARRPGPSAPDHHLGARHLVLHGLSPWIDRISAIKKAHSGACHALALGPVVEDRPLPAPPYENQSRHVANLLAIGRQGSRGGGQGQEIKTSARNGVSQPMRCCPRQWRASGCHHGVRRCPTACRTRPAASASHGSPPLFATAPSAPWS